MPIKQIIRAKSTPIREDLRHRLADEWRSPHEEESEPVIIEERTSHGPLHLYVIWNDWSLLNLQERSEIIMDAYEDVKGLDEAAKVTVAMGLTGAEAERMGIHYE